MVHSQQVLRALQVGRAVRRMTVPSVIFSAVRSRLWYTKVFVSMHV